MTDRDALLAAALGAPADDTVRLVLADFLQEQGDVNLGRFIRAGVVASRVRGTPGGGDTESVAARAEITALGSSGAPAGWLAALGLGPAPFTPRDWGWEATADRVTVRGGAAAGHFERGMLAALVVRFDEVLSAGPAALARWPVERFAAADVPGLTVWVGPPDEDRPGWQVTAGFTVHPRRAPPHGLGRFVQWVESIPMFSPDPAVLPPNPVRRWASERCFPDRPALVANFSAAVETAVAEVREAAGALWPGWDAHGAAGCSG